MQASLTWLPELNTGAEHRAKHGAERKKVKRLLVWQPQHQQYNRIPHSHLHSAVAVQHPYPPRRGRVAEQPDTHTHNANGIRRSVHLHVTQALIVFS
jgi:hypothetical protein